MKNYENQQKTIYTVPMTAKSPYHAIESTYVKEVAKFLSSKGSE